MSVTSIMNNYNYWQFIVSFIPIVINFITFYVILSDTMFFICIIPIKSYVIQRIIGSLNQKITHVFNTYSEFPLNRLDMYRDVKDFIVNHNDLCSKLADYNHFWSHLVFIAFLCLIPINLIITHQFLFENNRLEFKIFSGFMIIVCHIFIFVFQFIAAVLSLRIHRSAKRLSQLQWKAMGWPYRLRFKIKILCYFERLASAKKIGITIGPLGAFTIPLFYKVCDI